LDFLYSYDREQVHNLSAAALTWGRSQNPRIWVGNDGEHPASYEITARTVKFLGKREGNGGAPIGAPPPEGYEKTATLSPSERKRTTT